MIVTCSGLPHVLEKLSSFESLSLDTETTGLAPYRGDRLFSIIISNGDEDYYFNFQAYGGFDSEYVLPYSHIRERLQEQLFSDTKRTWYLHNAKFDMAFLANEEAFLQGRVHDTMVMARLIYNDHPSYSLDACVKRELGEEKDNAVEEHIKKEKLWEWVTHPGKKKREKKKFYDQVPPGIIVPYGEKDARLTYRLGKTQSAQIDKESKRLYEEECRLTKCVFAMERRGIKVGEVYCRDALNDEKNSYLDASQRFESICGMPFIDSNKVLAEAFTKVGEPYPTTDKGNPSFTDKVLSHMKSPLARTVQDYRYHYKMAHTYYQNFLEMSDGTSRLHANFRQSQTSTGRFAMAEPNLQNVPKELPEGKKWSVRHAFIPSPDYYLVEIDYDAMEFKLMLDYTHQDDLIAKIKDGLDPHQATADLAGITRKQAKTLNFGLLYGMGVGKLAIALGIDEREAYEFKAQYFGRLPYVKEFIYTAMATAKVRGWVRNWAGRKYHFPDTNFAYKAPNSIIQGGCADIVRLAMNRLYTYLNDKRSRMLLQVHDSILLEVHKDELDIPAAARTIMEEAFPYKKLPQTCTIEWSAKNWAELLDFSSFPTDSIDHGEKGGDQFQRQSCSA